MSKEKEYRLRIKMAANRFEKASIILKKASQFNKPGRLGLRELLGIVDAANESANEGVDNVYLAKKAIREEKDAI